MLTAGAVAPAVKPPAPAVESKLWHCGGQTVSSYLLKRVFLTLADEWWSKNPAIPRELEDYSLIHEVNIQF